MNRPTPLVLAHEKIQRAVIKERKGNFEAALELHKSALIDLNLSLDSTSCSTVIKSLKLQIEVQRRQIKLLSNKNTNVNKLMKALENNKIQMAELKTSNTSEVLSDVSSSNSSSLHLNDTSSSIVDKSIALESLINSAESQLRSSDFKVKNLSLTIEKMKVCQSQVVNLSKKLEKDNNYLRTENEKLILKVKELESKMKTGRAINLNEDSAHVDLLAAVHEQESVSDELPPLPNPSFDFIENLLKNDPSFLGNK